MNLLTPSAPRTSIGSALRPLATVVALLCVATPGMAGVTVDTVVTQVAPIQGGNWSTSFTVPRVDPAVARLVEVRLRLTIVRRFQAFVENQAPEAQLTPIFYFANSSVSVINGVSVPLVVDEVSQVTPIPSLPAFDGVLDFGGASGLNLTIGPASVTREVRFFPGDPLTSDFLGTPGNPGVTALGLVGQAVTLPPVLTNLFFLAPPPEAGATVELTIVSDPIDCNGNGIADATDLQSGTSLDCDGNQFPDECEHDHDADGVPDACDPQCAGAGSDADGDGILDVCDTVVDCDADDIPDAFEVDRNHNGLADTCEFSTDCNHNGLPDALDIAAGLSVDGDQNGVPDSCQTTALGFFLDCACAARQACASVPNSTGLGARLELAGSCSVSANQFSLTASSLPARRPALVFSSDSAAPVQIGAALPCVAGAIHRMGIVTTDALGTARIDVDLSTLSAGAFIHAWEERTFQLAFRDRGLSGPVIAFTDALSVRFCP